MEKVTIVIRIVIVMKKYAFYRDELRGASLGGTFYVLGGFQGVIIMISFMVNHPADQDNCRYTL